jgi:hypothetical protein
VVEKYPANEQNQVLRVVSNNDGDDQGVYGILGNAEIANGTTKTLFFRFRASSPGTNHSLGLTDITPTVLADFRVQLIINGNTLQIRDSATTRYLTPSINTGSWYNLWVVVNNAVDNAADNTKLYLTQGIAGATDGNRMKEVGTQKDTFAFYKGTTNSLNRFFWLTRATNEERAWIDDVYLMDVTVTPLPNPVSLAAHSPTPANGATVATTTVLSWSTGTEPNDPASPNPAITNHYLYINTDSNLVGQLKQTIPAGSPVNPTASYAYALAEDMTYYWRVDESVNNSLPTEPNTIIGPVWNFTTQNSVPVITQQPANVRVFPTETAQIAIAFTSTTTPTVVWKKVATPTDITLNSGGNILITTTSVGKNYTTTLQIANVVNDDQGLYYCVLTNTGRPASPVTSNSAELVVKKMLAWYKFENNFKDSAGTNDGTGAADVNDVPPTFVPGIVGNYAVSFGGKGADVDLDPNAYPKAGVGAGMDEGTMCCCAKAAQAGTFYSNYNDGTMTGFEFSLTSTSMVKMILRGESGNGWGGYYGVDVGTVVGKPSSPTFNMFDGSWHFVAATWKKSNPNDPNQMIVYVDGVQVASVTAGSPETFAAWQRSSTIGASRSAADRTVLKSFYGGAMDDLRVYNYVLDKHAIADIYYAIFHKNVCIETYSITYDFDGDCKIGLNDFMAFASAWLDCGLYPYCP